VVLDTNVVLDWLVFRDPRATRLVAALECGLLCWLGCARMRDELRLTLAYPALARWQPDPVRVLAAYDRHATVCPEPPRLASRALTCRDPDDQVFLDLAVAGNARWLVTHDRALLSLSRAARLHGVVLTRPADWLPP
jgi:putative PIN family toxin of toxin-antitoxin system